MLMGLTKPRFADYLNVSGKDTGVVVTAGGPGVGHGDHFLIVRKVIRECSS